MILAYLENTNGKLPKGALITISAALQAKATHGYNKAVGVLLGGVGCADAAKEASRYGLDEVVYLSDDLLKIYLTATHSQALKKICDELNPTLVVGASTSLGKDLLPVLAQYLAAGLASDVLEFTQGAMFKRPMYAGNVLATVEIITEKKVASIRTAAFDAVEATGVECPVRELSISLEKGSLQQFLSFDQVKRDRPELIEADRVVSGGRALKSKENFDKYIAPLADLLGAAIGATRAAVDAGFAPNDWQVGQTGKIVSPDLYIAIGISGAIQHLAGMKDSKVIVAINKDEEAPIFEVADYGLVADLYQVVPEFVEELKKAISS